MEHDINYVVRVCIDHNIKIGKWYDLKTKDSVIVGLS